MYRFFPLTIILNDTLKQIIFFSEFYKSCKKLKCSYYKTQILCLKIKIEKLIVHHILFVSLCVTDSENYFRKKFALLLYCSFSISLSEKNIKQ